VRPENRPTLALELPQFPVHAKASVAAGVVSA